MVHRAVAVGRRCDALRLPADHAAESATDATATEQPKSTSRSCGCTLTTTANARRTNMPLASSLTGCPMKSPIHEQPAAALRQGPDQAPGPASSPLCRLRNSCASASNSMRPIGAATPAARVAHAAGLNPRVWRMRRCCAKALSRRGSGRRGGDGRRRGAVALAQAQKAQFPKPIHQPGCANGEPEEQPQLL
mgnify:CR=1 FL=1